VAKARSGFLLAMPKILWIIVDLMRLSLKG
jgi:hypothetical protein